MKHEILHLDYEIKFDDYRRHWFDAFKQSVPNLVFFWGTAVILSFLGLLFTNETLVFMLTTITFSSIPIYLVLTNYQSYMRDAKKAFRQLSESQRQIHLTFQSDSDGFDCMTGKDFSHISWESINSVIENQDFFIFEMSGNHFSIPKIALRNDAETDLLRTLISSNIGNNAKLLN
jgi:hypothetical protein